MVRIFTLDGFPFSRTLEPLIKVQVSDLDVQKGGYLYEMMSGAQNKPFTVSNNGDVKVKPHIVFDREVRIQSKKINLYVKPFVFVH